MLESSGVIVVRKNNDNNKYLFLLLRSYNFWDFPKGKTENNENKFETAIREVNEETGIGDLNFKWGKVFFKTKPFGVNKKSVNYFIAETEKEDIVILENPKDGVVEHDGYGWFSVEECQSILVPRIYEALEWSVKRIQLDC